MNITVRILYILDNITYVHKYTKPVLTVACGDDVRLCC